MRNIWTTFPLLFSFFFFVGGGGEGGGRGVNLKNHEKIVKFRNNCSLTIIFWFTYYVCSLFLLFVCSTYKGSPSHFLLYQSTNHLHTRPCHQNANYLVMIYFWNLKFALKFIIFSFDTFEITNVLLSFFFKFSSYRFHFLLHNF